MVTRCWSVAVHAQNTSGIYSCLYITLSFLSQWSLFCSCDVKSEIYINFLTTREKLKSLRSSEGPMQFPNGDKMGRT